MQVHYGIQAMTFTRTPHKVGFRRPICFWNCARLNQNRRPGPEVMFYALASLNQLRQPCADSALREESDQWNFILETPPLGMLGAVATNRAAVEMNMPSLVDLTVLVFARQNLSVSLSHSTLVPNVTLTIAQPAEPHQACTRPRVAARPS